MDSFLVEKSNISDPACTWIFSRSSTVWSEPIKTRWRSTEKVFACRLDRPLPLGVPSLLGSTTDAIKPRCCRCQSPTSPQKKYPRRP
jgi:hypothetical protein